MRNTIVFSDKWSIHFRGRSELGDLEFTRNEEKKTLRVGGDHLADLSSPQNFSKLGFLYFRYFGKFDWWSFGFEFGYSTKILDANFALRRAIIASEMIENTGRLDLNYQINYRSTSGWFWPRSGRTWATENGRVIIEFQVRNWIGIGSVILWTIF